MSEFQVALYGITWYYYVQWLRLMENNNNVPGVKV